jgi:hypothetical protein
MNAIGVPVQPSVVVGGGGCARGPIPGYNASICGGCGHYARALVLTLLLRDAPSVADAAARWEGEALLPLLAAEGAGFFTADDGGDGGSGSRVRLSYMAQRSVGDEIAVVSTQNSWVVGVSYVAMLLYVSLALGKAPHPVASRGGLGLQGERRGEGAVKRGNCVVWRRRA